MSLTMDITATEHGIVRLFAIETVQSFDHSNLTQALGVEILDPERRSVTSLKYICLFVFHLSHAVQFCVNVNSIIHIYTYSIVS